MTLKDMIDNDKKMKINIPDGFIYLFDSYEGPVFLEKDKIKEWHTSVAAIYITMNNGMQYLANGDTVPLAVKTLKDGQTNRRTL